MKKTQDNQIIPAAEVILIGGGHSHLEVIRRYGELSKKPFRMTLINESPSAAYAGTLANYVAGNLKVQEAFVDLGHICHRAGVRFVKSRVNKILPDEREVLIDRSPLALHYEALSIDLGSTTSIETIPGLPKEKLLGAVPITKFLKGLKRLDKVVESASGTAHLVMIGADIPGLELILSLTERYETNKIAITIVVERSHFLPDTNPKVAATFSAWCQSANIKIITGSGPKQFADHQLELTNGQKLACDMVFYGEANLFPPLLNHCGLRLTASGQMAVNENLESSSHDGVYAAGDVAGIESPVSISKSGVYGRQMGRILSENITRRFTGLSQLRYQPKRFPLSFYTYGRKSVLGLFGNWTLTSQKLVGFKERMDRNRMEQFQPDPLVARVPTFIESGNMTETPCCGSGATLPPDLLAVIPKGRQNPQLETFDTATGETVLTLGEGKDAQKISQTFAYHRTFTRDLYNFGRISATHCLTSLYSTGQQPLTAHVLATIGFGPKQAMTEDLSLLLDGVTSVLDYDEVTMAGSQSQFGLEPGVGMMVQAVCDPQKPIWSVNKAQVGDAILLTKPLGSGILFAAHSRYHLSSQDFYRSMERMSASHMDGLQHCHDAGVQAATNFGGYGLAWHLSEMGKASLVHIQIDLDSLPIYDGIYKAMKAGIRASLHVQNRTSFDRSLHGLDKTQLSTAESLFDPQTAGGIVMTVPQQKAEALVEALRQSGLADTAIIGKCLEIDDGYPALRLKEY